MKYSGLALVWGSDIRDLKTVLKTHAGDGPNGVKAFELCTQNWLGWKSDTAGHVCNPRLGQRMREDRKIKVFHSCINSSRPSFAIQPCLHTIKTNVQNTIVRADEDSGGAEAEPCLIAHGYFY